MPTNQSVNITINNSDTQGQKQKQDASTTDTRGGGGGVAEVDIVETVNSEIAEPEKVDVKVETVKSTKK